MQMRSAEEDEERGFAEGEICWRTAGEKLRNARLAARYASLLMATCLLSNVAAADAAAAVAAATSVVVL